MINLTSNIVNAMFTITSMTVMSKIVNYLKSRANNILKNSAYRKITMLGNLNPHYVV